MGHLAKKFGMVFLGLSVVIGILFYNLSAFASFPPPFLEFYNDSGHVILDEQSNQYWYWNLSNFTYMNYAEQKNFINDLNEGGGYFGIDTWHMASAAELQTLFYHAD